MSNPARPAEPTAEVTIWSLEQTSPDDLRPSAAPEGDIRIVRSGIPLPEFSRFLYTAVGGDIRWTDRLTMTYAQWQEALDRPGAETWVAYADGTPAGYIELDPQDDGVVEIMYFGLIPAFRGRRIGGHLLSYGVARAWDLAERWPQRPHDEAGVAAHLLQGRAPCHGQLSAPRLPALRHPDRTGARGRHPGSVAGFRPGAAPVTRRP